MFKVKVVLAVISVLNFTEAGFNSKNFFAWYDNVIKTNFNPLKHHLKKNYITSKEDTGDRLHLDVKPLTPFVPRVKNTPFKGQQATRNEVGQKWSHDYADFESVAAQGQSYLGNANSRYQEGGQYDSFPSDDQLYDQVSENDFYYQQSDSNLKHDINSFTKQDLLDFKQKYPQGPKHDLTHVVKQQLNAFSGFDEPKHDLSNLRNPQLHYEPTPVPQSQTTYIKQLLQEKEKHQYQHQNVINRKTPHQFSSKPPFQQSYPHTHQNPGTKASNVIYQSQSKPPRSSLVQNYGFKKVQNSYGHMQQQSNGQKIPSPYPKSPTILDQKTRLSHHLSSSNSKQISTNVHIRTQNRPPSFFQQQGQISPLSSLSLQKSPHPKPHVSYYPAKVSIYLSKPQTPATSEEKVPDRPTKGEKEQILQYLKGLKDIDPELYQRYFEGAVENSGIKKPVYYSKPGLIQSQRPQYVKKPSLSPHVNRGPTTSFPNYDVIGPRVPIQHSPTPNSVVKSTKEPFLPTPQALSWNPPSQKGSLNKQHHFQMEGNYGQTPTNPGYKTTPKNRFLPTVSSLGNSVTIIQNGIIRKRPQVPHEVITRYQDNKIQSLPQDNRFQDGFAENNQGPRYPITTPRMKYQDTKFESTIARTPQVTNYKETTVMLSPDSGYQTKEPQRIPAMLSPDSGYQAKEPQRTHSISQPDNGYKGKEPQRIPTMFSQGNDYQTKNPNRAPTMLSPDIGYQVKEPQMTQSFSSPDNSYQGNVPHRIQTMLSPENDYQIKEPNRVPTMLSSHNGYQVKDPPSIPTMLSPDNGYQMKEPQRIPTAFSPDNGYQMQDTNRIQTMSSPDNGYQKKDPTRIQMTLAPDNGYQMNDHQRNPTMLSPDIGYQTNEPKRIPNINLNLNKERPTATVGTIRPSFMSNYGITMPTRKSGTPIPGGTTLYPALMTKQPLPTQSIAPYHVDLNQESPTGNPMHQVPDMFEEESDYEDYFTLYENEGNPVNIAGIFESGHQPQDDRNEFLYNSPMQESTLGSDTDEAIQIFRNDDEALSSPAEEEEEQKGNLDEMLLSLDNLISFLNKSETKTTLSTAETIEPTTPVRITPTQESFLPPSSSSILPPPTSSSLFSPEVTRLPNFSSNNRLFNLPFFQTSPSIKNILASMERIAEPWNPTPSDDEDDILDIGMDPLAADLLKMIRQVPVESRRRMLAQLMFSVPLAAATMSTVGVPDSFIAPLATVVPGFLVTAFNEDAEQLLEHVSMKDTRTKGLQDLVRAIKHFEMNQKRRALN